MRTGTVATIDNATWDLRDQPSGADALSQSRAVALDMESATIAANGYRFRVPFTARCFASLPNACMASETAGMASDFYKTQVARHLMIGFGRWNNCPIR